MLAIDLARIRISFQGFNSQKLRKIRNYQGQDPHLSLDLHLSLSLHLNLSLSLMVDQGLQNYQEWSLRLKSQCLQLLKCQLWKMHQLLSQQLLFHLVQWSQEQLYHLMYWDQDLEQWYWMMLYLMQLLWLHWMFHLSCDQELCDWIWQYLLFHLMCWSQKKELWYWMQQYWMQQSWFHWMFYSSMSLSSRKNCWPLYLLVILGHGSS